VHFRSASLQLSSSFSRTCTAQSYYISRYLCNDAGPHQERQSAEHTHTLPASGRTAVRSEAHECLSVSVSRRNNAHTVRGSG
jgi:hypothetical protein